MNNYIKCFIVFAILMLPTFVFAEDDTAQFSVSPFIGYYVFDNDLYLENKMGYGARMGYNFDKHWGIEGSLGYTRTELTEEAMLLYMNYQRFDLLGLGAIEIEQINDNLLQIGLLDRLIELRLIDADTLQADLLGDELANLDLLAINNGGSGSLSLTGLLFSLLNPYYTGGDISVNGDVDVFNYNLDVLYHFYPEEKLVPFVCAGAGGTTIKYPEGIKDKNEFSLNCGGGVKYFVNDKVAVRCDARNITMIEGADTDEIENIQEYSAGISFLFGTEKKPVAAPGVRDSDGDGVPDNLDKCPNTPRGVKVDKYGCPLDSDKDGVPDYLDRCPDTPKGAKVDERGCWSFQSDNVLFDFDKYELKSQAYPILDEVVVILKRDKDLRVEVRGHTCNIGTEEYNKKLSERRARAVVEYLINKGIDPKRLNSSGYGENMPAYSNDIEAQRMKNRRVEFIPIR